MGESCYSPEQLAELATLAADDPRRAHLENCPHCRALLAAYQERRARGPRSGFARRVRDLLNFPRLRPVLAVAAALLLILGLPAVIDRHHEEAPQPDPQSQAPAEGGAVLASGAVLQADGTIRFSWRPTSGAEFYRLELYGADLTELAHLGTRSDSVFVLEPGMLRGGVDFPAIAYWRLGAVARSEVILRSPLQAFPKAAPQESP
jgi:hypothetical protein